MTTTVYAKIHNGSVIEIPVSYSTIVKRGDPMRLYLPVVYNPKPAVPAYYTLKTITTVEASQVRVSYQVVPMKLEALIFRIHHPDGNINTVVENPSIATVDPLLVKAIVDSATLATQKKLDAFAQTRGYDGIQSAATYAGSSVVKFATEGTRAKELRDNTWNAMYDYFALVQTAAAPLPKNEGEIFATHPALSWE